MGPWWWGGPCDDDAGSESGSASVFDGASGAQLRKLRAADGALGAAGYFFGRPVVASSGGSLVVVGGPYDDDAGSESSWLCARLRRGQCLYIKTSVAEGY